MSSELYPCSSQPHITLVDVVQSLGDIQVPRDGLKSTAITLVRVHLFNDHLRTGFAYAMTKGTSLY